MNLSLTPDLEKFIADEVESGRFSTPGEVVWHALTLLAQSRLTREEQIEEFNREIAARIASLDRGEHVTAKESERHFRERSARRKAELQAKPRA
jgi:antitoxin ParD1/3/4